MWDCCDNVSSNKMPLAAKILDEDRRSDVPFSLFRAAYFLANVKCKTSKLNLKRTWIFFESELQLGKGKASALMPRQWGFMNFFTVFDHIWPHILTTSQSGIHGIYGNYLHYLYCLVYKIGLNGLKSARKTNTWQLGW